MYDLSIYNLANKYIANYVYYDNGTNLILDDRDSIYYHVNNTTTIKSSNKSTIYPNPNSGTFIVKYKPTTQTLSIKNILGQEVVYENLEGKTETEITLQNQPKGIYLVEIHYQNGEVKREKMVVE